MAERTPTDALIRTGHKHPDDALNALADYGFMVVDAAGMMDGENMVRAIENAAPLPGEGAYVECAAAYNEMIRRRVRFR